MRRGTSHWTHKFAPKVNQRRIKEDAPASGYFLDCSALASYPGPFDASGVPLIDYPAGLGRRYNPGWIGEYALACYQRYLEEKDGGLLDRFLCQLDWFVANQRERGQGQFIVWPYLFDWHGDLSAPWISCLSQSLAISVLVRGYLITGKSDYLDMAAKALGSFQVGLEQGGVARSDTDGNLFFEEAPTAEPSTILNGFVFGLWGVYEYWQVSGSPQAEDLFQAGSSSLARTLARYDLGIWSRYSLRRGRFGLPDIASRFYHELHIVQLEVLGSLTGEPVFLQFAERWRQCRARAGCRALALATKVLYKLIGE